MANLNDLPQAASVASFKAALNSHSKVDEVLETNIPYTVVVSLESGRSLTVKMTNIYCLGEADVVEFLQNEPGVDAIVTLSAWNSVSHGANEYGKSRNVGVFTWKQFFGSLNYRKYWLYEELPFGLEGLELAAEKRRRSRAWN